MYKKATTYHNHTIRNDKSKHQQSEMNAKSTNKPNNITLHPVANGRAQNKLSSVHKVKVQTRI